MIYTTDTQNEQRNSEQNCAFYTQEYGNQDTNNTNNITYITV